MAFDAGVESTLWTVEKHRECGIQFLASPPEVADLFATVSPAMIAKLQPISCRNRKFWKFNIPL